MVAAALTDLVFVSAYLPGVGRFVVLAETWGLLMWE